LSSGVVVRPARAGHHEPAVSARVNLNRGPDLADEQ
jgi:hypothetical protein